MIINDILSSDHVLCNANGSSKKRVLENISDFLSSKDPRFDSTELFEHLVNREKLGSTGIGKGVAIPHCRSEKTNETLGCLVTLEEPIDFDAADDLPVDLLFVLIVPENATDSHLNLLAEIAQLMDQAEFRNRLRKSQTDIELFEAATTFIKAA